MQICHSTAKKKATCEMTAEIWRRGCIFSFDSWPGRAYLNPQLDVLSVFFMVGLHRCHTEIHGSIIFLSPFLLPNSIMHNFQLLMNAVPIMHCRLMGPENTVGGCEASASYSNIFLLAIIMIIRDSPEYNPPFHTLSSAIICGAEPLRTTLPLPFILHFSASMAST